MCFLCNSEGVLGWGISMLFQPQHLQMCHSQGCVMMKWEMATFQCWLSQSRGMLSWWLWVKWNTCGNRTRQVMKYNTHHYHAISNDGFRRAWTRKQKEKCIYNNALKLQYSSWAPPFSWFSSCIFLHAYWIWKKSPRKLVIQVSSLYYVKAQLSSYWLIQSWSSEKKKKKKKAKGALRPNHVAILCWVPSWGQGWFNRIQFLKKSRFVGQWNNKDSGSEFRCIIPYCVLKGGGRSCWSQTQVHNKPATFWP